MDSTKTIITDLMVTVQSYELTEKDTSVFKGISHNQLVDAVNQFLFLHGSIISISSWTEKIHGLKESGVDSIWKYGRENSTKIGLQIKADEEFETKIDSFRRIVFAQISESRQMGLSGLLLCLCADLSSPSHREKCRGIQADIEKMKDGYAEIISPTKMVGIWKWFQGLQITPLDQIRNSGYAWLSVVYDSLGNRNLNSWGKGTGGGWSNSKTTTLKVGQVVNFQAIGLCYISNELEYRFSIQRTGRSFEVRRDWLPDSYWQWVVDKLDIGRNVVVMISVRRVKDYYQFNNADDYTYAIYDVLPSTLKSNLKGKGK